MTIEPNVDIVKYIGNNGHSADSIVVKIYDSEMKELSQLEAIYVDDNTSKVILNLPKGTYYVELGGKKEELIVGNRDEEILDTLLQISTHFQYEITTDSLSATNTIYIPDVDSNYTHQVVVIKTDNGSYTRYIRLHNETNGIILNDIIPPFTRAKVYVLTQSVATDNRLLSNLYNVFRFIPVDKEL